MRPPVHEFDVHGNHRVVFIDDAGKRMEGPWVRPNQLAQVKGFYAATGAPLAPGQLPEGVMRINWVPHDVVRYERQTPPRPRNGAQRGAYEGQERDTRKTTFTPTDPIEVERMLQIEAARRLKRQGE